MSEIDWSNAPEGATHKAKHGAFFKLDVSGVFMHENGAWKKLGWASWQIEGFEKRPPAWSGDGLPPVGTYIEWLSAQYGWLGGRVVGHDGMVTVVSHNDGYTGCHAHEIRPIRTPEQIAAEERENAVKEMETVAAKAWRETPIGMDMITEICSALYDAGFQVPKQ